MRPPRRRLPAPISRIGAHDGLELLIVAVHAGRVAAGRAVSTASSSIWRAMMIALSAGPRCSCVRSTIGPMLSWTALSWLLMPTIPENSSVFWAWRSMR